MENLLGDKQEMKSTYATLVIALLIVGLLSACAAQATEAPSPTSVSQPTKISAVPTQAVTEAPALSNTTLPPTEVPATQASVQGDAVSFTHDVLPIFESRCKNCHGGNRSEEGLDLLTYADLMNGSKNGPVVLPGNATNSLLIELLVNQKMPKRGPKLTPSQIQPIIDWINQGALEN
jgi:cytochrome c5